MRATPSWASAFPANTDRWPQVRAHSGVPALAFAVDRSGGHPTALRRRRRGWLAEHRCRPQGRTSLPGPSAPAPRT